MAEPAPEIITDLLLELGQGDEAALSRLIPQVYDELHRLAQNRMRSERPGHTLQPTALVNEVYLRLAAQKRTRWRNRAQFFAIAARLMRRILVDHARGRRSKKRQVSRITFEEGEVAAPESSADVIALDEALRRLAGIDSRKSRVVELRIFGGLTIEDTAEVLGVSIGTVINDYRTARAWLRRELEG